MNRIEFEELLEQKAFYDSGGGIFKEYYSEALRGVDSLDQTIEDILTDIDEEFEDEPEMVEKLRNINTETLKNKIVFFNTYLLDRICSHPELCGQVIGILSRDEHFKEAIDLIGLDDKNIEYFEWDS